MDGDRLVILLFLTATDEEHVFILQLDIGRSAFQNAEHIDALHLQRTVFLHAVHHGMLPDGILCQSVSSFDKGFHR